MTSITLRMMKIKLALLVLPALFVLFGAGCDLVTDFSKVIYVDIDAPEMVVVGDVFDVSVSVQNTDSKPYTFYDLEIGDALFEGLELKGTVPPYESSFHIPVFDLVNYTYDTEILAGESFEVVLTFEALQEGQYFGPLNACVGDDANCIEEKIDIIVE